MADTKTGVQSSDVNVNDIALSEKVSYGIGAYGKDAVYAIVAAFLMVYYTDVVGVSPAFVGGLFLVARVWDAFNDPMMGWIVDNTHTKYGKFRPWILGGTLINSVVLVLLYFNPAEYFAWQGTLVNVWCAVTYLMWGMTYTLMDVPYWAMIPAFSSDSRVRDQMSVIPRRCAMFGGTTVGTFGLMIIAFLGVNLGGTPSDGYFRFAFAVAVIFVICEVICFFNVREHVETPKQDSIKAKDVFKVIAQNDQLLIIIILTMLQMVGIYLFQGMNVYFFKYVIQDETWFAINGGVSFGAQLFAFVTFPKFVHKFSRRVAYVTAYGLFILGSIGMFFTGMPGANIYLFFGCALVYYMGNALAMVSTTVMLADSCDYGEYKVGKRSEGLVFSSQTLTVKFGAAVAGAIGGFVLSIVGYVPNEVQSAETILGMRLVMFGLSSAVFLIIILMYLKFYKLYGDFYKDMLSMLEIARKERAATLTTETSQVSTSQNLQNPEESEEPDDTK